jgi:hypothetical protein
MVLFNSFKYTSFRSPGKGGNPPWKVRETALKPVKSLFNHFHAFFPSNSTLLPLGRIYTSLSLFGSKSITDKRGEVEVFARFSGAGPIELTVEPMCAAYWAVSVGHGRGSPR